MIQGKVAQRQAVVDLPFALSDARIEIECVIDTGFEGALTLPPDAIAALKLPYLTEISANLADASDVRVDVYVGVILWHGLEREVAVLSMGQRPLLGTALLERSRLEIDFSEGGLVTIEEV
jgi:clan AA aspartic protease